MSDLQTALTKALEDGKRRFLTATVQEWDDHEQQIRQPQPQTQPQPQPTQEKAVGFTKTGNMSKDTFDYVKENASLLTQAKAAHDMAAMGYKYASVQALITQMKKNGMMRLDSYNKLYVTQDEYKPFVNPYLDKTKAKQNKAQRKEALKKIKAQTTAQQQAQAWAGIAALQAPATPVPVAVPEQVATKWDADTVLENMSIKEAHKLWVELSKMFG
jgi:hypothetical protein